MQDILGAVGRASNIFNGRETRVEAESSSASVGDMGTFTSMAMLLYQRSCDNYNGAQFRLSAVSSGGICASTPLSCIDSGSRSFHAPLQVTAACRLILPQPRGVSPC